MASIALMIGGAIINATTFVGGSYLAKYLSGGSDSDEEKKRHDLAVEKYQKEYEKYEENRAKLNDWIMTNDRIKDEAKQNFENTDYALKLYNKVHQDDIYNSLREPQFSDFYQPSVQQNKGEIIYVGASALDLWQVISFNKMQNKKTVKRLLFSKRILEGIVGCEEIISRSWCVGR